MTPVDIEEPAILIRIPQLYRPNMSESDLYDATRGHWKIGPRRAKARYALAVADGIVRGVYEIHQWHRAGTTTANAAVHEGAAPPGRWEFTGELAPALCRRYVGRSVSHYFPRGYATPYLYVNC